MKKEDCFHFGDVVRTSGVKGEILLEMDVDEPARYGAIDALFLDMHGSLVPFFVTGTKRNGKALTLALEGIESPEQAKELVGFEAFLPLAVLPELDETRFYFHEINGYEVIDERYGVVGIAEDVVDRMMQPVLRVMNGRQEVLIPLLKGAVKKIDRAAKKLHIQSPEGLIEIYIQLPREE